jgi:hypothetical protein
MKMLEEFSTEEISRSIKDFGYDRHCFGFYADGKPYTTSPITNTELNDPTKILGGKKYITALLWQQVTEWLNDEHGIFITYEDNRHGEPTDKLPYGYQFYISQHGHCIVGRGDKYYNDDKIVREAAILAAIKYLKENEQ